MTTLAEVSLWGRTIGAVALADGSDVATFEYDAAFAQSGIEVAPLMMPLSRRVFRFPNLPRDSFHGLPGLLADALPDKFGNALIDAWLAQQGRSPASFNAVERLCYTGQRAMGALEFSPVLGPHADQSQHLEVDRLVALASSVLTQRSQLHAQLSSDKDAAALTNILQVGTSAGGARAKAVIAWNPATNEVRSGQLPTDSGFEQWLLKFDGVSNNRDKELADPQGFGAIEFAYYQMAKLAGITMSPCRLFEEGDRRHFMTRRFDRTADGKKRHMQTLAALGHYDFNAAGAHSYEQAFWVMRQLGLPAADLAQLFRRMVFNIVARNQDDHVKNIAFLMDKRGQWSLAPAYDVTYSYNPTGLWTGQHQMSLNGKRDDFTIEDLQSCADAALLKRGEDKRILRDVCEAVNQWPRIAKSLDIPAEQMKTLAHTFRLKEWRTT